MGGLLVLALIAGYVWGVSKLFRRVHPWWAKALVIIAAILIPTVDAVYGRIKLKQMCATEGGLHIYRVVERVAGFGKTKGEPVEQWLRREGYKFVEGIDRSDKPSRMSLQDDGTIVLEVGIVPISEYVYEEKLGSSSDIFSRTEKSVRVKTTGEILSRAINISYAGGWFERFVSGLYAARGTAGTCGPNILITEIVTTTLKPTK
jgi:hypothetical protein